MQGHGSTQPVEVYGRSPGRANGRAVVATFVTGSAADPGRKETK